MPCKRFANSSAARLATTSGLGVAGRAAATSATTAAVASRPEVAAVTTACHLTSSRPERRFGVTRLSTAEGTVSAVRPFDPLAIANRVSTVFGILYAWWA